jgi:hypothetical protein
MTKPESLWVPERTEFFNGWAGTPDHCDVIFDFSSRGALSHDVALLCIVLPVFARGVIVKRANK